VRERWARPLWVDRASGRYLFGHGLVTDWSRQDAPDSTKVGAMPKVCAVQGLFFGQVATRRHQRNRTCNEDVVSSILTPGSDEAATRPDRPCYPGGWNLRARSTAYTVFMFRGWV
jgi:hypothetical protein